MQYVQTDPPTSKGLAALVIQLIQFQEDNFGKDVSKPPLTRLPVSQQKRSTKLLKSNGGNFFLLVEKCIDILSL